MSPFGIFPQVRDHRLEGAPTFRRRVEIAFLEHRRGHSARGQQRLRAGEHLGFVALDIHLEEDPPVGEVVAAGEQHVQRHGRHGERRVVRRRIRRPGRVMLLDEMTRRNLELIEPLRAGEEGGTLLSVLDRSVTAMGGRLLRRWMLEPLVVADEIWSRQEAVSELFDRPGLRNAVRDALGDVADLERMAGKIGTMRVSPRDLAGLRRSLAILPEIQEDTPLAPVPLRRDIYSLETLGRDFSGLMRDAAVLADRLDAEPGLPLEPQAVEFDRLRKGMRRLDDQLA